MVSGQRDVSSCGQFSGHWTVVSGQRDMCSWVVGRTVVSGQRDVSSWVVSSVDTGLWSVVNATCAAGLSVHWILDCGQWST